MIGDGDDNVFFGGEDEFTAEVRIVTYDRTIRTQALYDEAAFGEQGEQLTSRATHESLGPQITVAQADIEYVKEGDRVFIGDVNGAGGAEYEIYDIFTDGMQAALLLEKS